MNGGSQEPGQTVALPNGRQLGYLIIGEGRPVFYLHGLPGSRVEALCLGRIADSRHLQIIAVDRPGMGLSTYAPNTRLRDLASDVAFLADKLGIERFALVGLSAGGPSALTCAALLSKRLIRVVVVSGASLPPDPSKMGLVWRIPYSLISVPTVNTWVTKMAGKVFLKMANDPDAYWQSWTGRLARRLLPEDDCRFMMAPSEIRDTVFRSWIEAHRQGPEGFRAVVHEGRLRKRGWDVDLSQIPRGLVHIWHGSADTSVRVADAYRNAKAVPGANLRVFDNEGHMCMFNHLEELGELLSS
jgi:pimeloyl-ACP methyl ester carboxylesterase